MVFEPEYTEFEQEYDGELDITDVRKHNWKSKNSRDFWNPGLKDFPRLFERVLAESVGKEDHPRKVFETSRGKIESNEELRKACKADGTVRKALSSGKVIVARDPETLDRYRRKLADGSTGAMRDVAKLRGYPDCCIEKSMEWRDRGLKDPVYEIACNTPSAGKEAGDPQVVRVEDPEPILNVIWAYLGWSFLRHQPCSFECDKSYDLAVTHGELFREIGRGDEAEQMLGFLGSPASWSGYHGLAHVKNGYCTGEYTTDERWSEKKVIWIEQHEKLRI